MKIRSWSVLLVIVSAMLWGTYGSFVTVILAQGLSGPVITCLRFLATCVPVYFFLLLRDRESLRIRKSDLPLFLANGLASILFFTLCYTAAIRETKIATAAALLYTSPAMVMLLSAAAFREKLTVRKILCVALSVLGCALISGLGRGAAGLTLRGLLLGLGAALGYSLYSVFSRIILDRGYSPLANVLYTFSVATAGYLVLIAANGSLPEIWLHPRGTLLSVICGLLTGLVPYLAYTVGLKDLEPSRAAQLATVEPVFAAVLGAVLFRQVLSLSETLGVATVVAAVIIMNVSSGKNAPES